VAHRSWCGCSNTRRSTPPGTSAKGGGLIEARFPVYETGRGGEFTYHGPGQRVVYLMLHIKQRRPDVRLFVATLEEWLIRTLAAFNVRGERREERVGVWVARPERGAGHEDKIAAIGIRLKRWVSLHGIALNVDPDLAHFSGIVPCGVADARYGVTSLTDLGPRSRCRRSTWRCGTNSRGCSGLSNPLVPAKVGAQSQVKKELDSRFRGNERRFYFFSSARRIHVIAFGWHAMPIFGQIGSPASERLQVRQPSVHSWQVLSLSP
jgi:lipoate-protein ligase B